MQKAAVRTSSQIIIPRAKLLHPCAGGLRAGVCHAGHGPEHVEEIAGVTGVTLRAVRGEAHAREELRAFGFAQQAEEHRNHAALAIVLVILDPRMMIAVRDGSFANVEAQQSSAALDGEIHRWIFDTRFTSQHERDRQWNAG
jgi:hypothetical protein